MDPLYFNQILVLAGNYRNYGYHFNLTLILSLFYLKYKKNIYGKKIKKVKTQYKIKNPKMIIKIIKFYLIDMENAFRISSSLSSSEIFFFLQVGMSVKPPSISWCSH